MGKKGKKYNRVIIIISVLAISLLLSGFFISRNVNIPNLFLKDGILLVDSIVSYPFSFLENNDLEEENEKLIRELEELREYKHENEELNQEISKLKEMLDINTLLSDKEHINASVVNRNLGYWNEKLTIDKGSDDGITNNMAVVSSGALIGVTSGVGSISGDVLLFSNSKFPMNVSVKIIIGDKEVYGILNNYSDSLYDIVGIVDNIEIPADSLVMTTGLGNIFPSGLYIGTVKEVVTDNFDLSKVVKVIPGTSFDNISYVTVVKREEK